MSDQSGGPGWWQASDLKWYPPELHPDYERPAAPVDVAPIPKVPWWRANWWIPAGALIVLASGVFVVATRDGDDPSPVKTRPTTTSTTVPTVGLEALIRAYESRFSADDPDYIRSVAEAAVAMCETMDAADGVSEDDAPNDSPASDAAIAASLKETVIGALVERLNDNIKVIVLRETAEHGCPAHRDAIDRFIEDHL